jgi:hypothetical protein
MQMQLASRLAFPEPLLAAMPQLSEKPRLGFRSKNPAWYPGFNVCNSTTVLGLQFRCSETVSGPVVAPNNGPTSQQINKECLQGFYNSGFGKAVNFMSLGSLVPGWGPDPMGSLKEWGLAIVGKGGGGKALVAALNSAETFTTLSGTTIGGSNAIAGYGLNVGLHVAADAGTVTMVAATGIDLLMHAGCYASAQNATGQANIPVYIAP